MAILGDDLGHYYSKSSNLVILESKVSKSNNDNLNKHDVLRIDGESYYLGEGIRDTNFRKIEKQNLIQLLFGLISLSTTDKFNEVIVGLPLSQYKKDKETLKQLILENRDKWIEINGEERHLIIDDVEIAPEGVYSVNSNYEGIIVDIGGGTTDVCLLETRNNRRKVINPISIPLGTIKLYQDFISVVNSSYGLDLMPDDSERIIKQGLKIYGEDKKISLDVFREYVELIVSRIQSEYSIKTYNITLIGGGSKLLYSSIKKRIPNVEIVDEPLFSNALGYKELGEELWG